MELSRTTILPIIRQATKTVVGAYNMGRYVAFDGTETSHQLPSTKTVTIAKWLHAGPFKNEVAPWFMAVVIDESTFKSNAWEGHAELLRLTEIDDHTRFVAANGVANRVDFRPGTLLTTMSSITTKESPPQCNIVPTVQRTGDTLTIQNGGTWKGLEDNTPAVGDLDKSWFLESGSGTNVYEVVDGETSSSIELDAGWAGRRIYAKVTIEDENGSLGEAQSDPFMILGDT